MAVEERYNFSKEVIHLIKLIEVITLAIEAERASKEQYHQYAGEATDPEVRLMFEQLARDEERHEKQLLEKLRALKLLYLED